MAKKEKMIKKYERLYGVIKRTPQRGRHESEEMTEFMSLREELEPIVTKEEKFQLDKLLKRALQ